MEEQNGGYHAEHIAQTYHRIGHAEGKVFDDIHPQQRGEAKADATSSKLPIQQQAGPKRLGPTKWRHLGEGKLQEHLPGTEQ